MNSISDRTQCTIARLPIIILLRFAHVIFIEINVDKIINAFTKIFCKRLLHLWFSKLLRSRRSLVFLFTALLLPVSMQFRWHACNVPFAVCVCSCEEGYEGAYCKVASSTSEQALLISLSTLLPVAAALVVIVAVVFICRRLRTTPDISDPPGRRRNNIRAKYDVCLCNPTALITYHSLWYLNWKDHLALTLVYQRK